MISKIGCTIEPTGNSRSDIYNSKVINIKNNYVPKISIIIINYDGVKYLKNCLTSILNTNYPNFEIYFVDNCSNDDSLRFVKKEFPTVKIIKYEKNLGFALACNNAIKEVNSDYFVILNNDVEVSKNWLSELVKYIDSDKKIAAVTSKILFMKNKGKINSCGGIIDRYGFGLNRGNGDVDNNTYAIPEEVFYAVGTAMLIKRSAWLDVGEFDQNYFAYFEDLDWSWRARLKGYKILFIPTSIIYHFWRGSFTRRELIIYYYTRNRLATLIKNYSLPSLFEIIPTYALISILESLWIISKWTSYDFYVFIKAFIWNLKNFRKTLRSRYKIQSHRIVSDKIIQKHMVSHSIELGHISKSASKILSHPLLNQK
jgi:hypothetical protein